MDKVRFVVGSLNTAKVKAVGNALRLAPLDSRYSGSEVEIVSYSVSSGSSETPGTDTEGIEAVRHRLKELLSVDDDGELYFSLEGVTSLVETTRQIRGWAGVYHKPSDRLAICSGGSTQIPSKYAELYDPDTRFGDVIVDAGYKLTQTEAQNIHTVGVNGVLTNGVYDRTTSFTDAIRIAAATLFNERNYR